MACIILCIYPRFMQRQGGLLPRKTLLHLKIHSFLSPSHHFSPVLPNSSRLPMRLLTANLVPDPRWVRSTGAGRAASIVFCRPPIISPHESMQREHRGGVASQARAELHEHTRSKSSKSKPKVATRAVEREARHGIVTSLCVGPFSSKPSGWNGFWYYRKICPFLAC